MSSNASTGTSAGVKVGKPRLLLAVHQIPFPRTRDGAVIIVHPLLEHLSDEYAIDLVCPVFRGDEQDRQAVAAIRPYCDRVIAFPFTGNQIWRWLIVVFDPRSLVYFLYPRSVIRRRILSRMQDRVGHYHAVVIQDPHLAIFVDLFDPQHKARRILISIDYWTLHFERQAAAPGVSLRRLYWWLTARRVAKYEPRVYRMFDVVTYVSGKDRKELAERYPDLAARVGVIPIAVDIASWRSGSDAAAPEKDTVLFTGNMNYGPNRQAVDWFNVNVWPLLRERRPSARWLIVGYDADKHLASLGPGVEVFSSVSAVLPFVQRSTVVISPLQSGTGIKNKVIEAMAASKCVVGTSLSFEGIDVTSGVEAIVVDDPREMADSLVSLFDDHARRTAIGVRAAGLALEQFEISHVMDRWRRTLNPSIARDR